MRSYEERSRARRAWRGMILTPLLLLVSVSETPAQNAAPANPATPPLESPSDLQTGPILSEHDHWAAVMLWTVLFGFFVPAAIVGPLRRRWMGNDLPELHQRQERDPHAASQHEPGHSID